MTIEEFIEKYCRICGNQRCGGANDEVYRGGCLDFRKEILGIETPNPHELIESILKEQNKRKIKKINNDGTYTEIEVDWSKMPCATCERRYHLTCPKGDCWNKNGKYITY